MVNVYQGQLMLIWGGKALSMVVILLELLEVLLETHNFKNSSLILVESYFVLNPSNQSHLA